MSTLDDIVAREVRTQVEQLLPEVQRQGEQFIVDVLKQAQATGSFDLGEFARSITITTPTGEDLRVASAKSRSVRTLIQGLLFDVLLGIVLVVGPLVSGLDLSTGASWALLGGSVAKSVLTSIVSYLMRLKVTPKYDQAVTHG